MVDKHGAKLAEIGNNSEQPPGLDGTIDEKKEPLAHGCRAAAVAF